VVDYTNSFKQLGAELKILRKTEALWEHSHFATTATYSKRQITAAYSTSVDEEEIAATNSKYALENTVSPTVASMHSSQRSAFETSFFPVLDVELSTSDEDKSAGAISYVYDSSLTNGQISILARKGRFGALRAKMLADSQTIQAPNLTYSALASAATNLGVLNSATSSIVGSDHTLSGIANFEVTDDTVDAPQFTVTYFLTKALPDGTTKITGDNALTLARAWQDGPTGLTATLVLGPLVKSGDTATCVLSPAITNPSEADSNKGSAYVYIERQAAAPIWKIQWYRDAALTSMVAETDEDTTVGSGTVALTGASGMTVGFSFSRGAAAGSMGVAGNHQTVTLNIKSPRLGDTWKKPITNDEVGQIASKLAHNYRVSLPSAAVGCSISDTYASSTSMI
jgi:hypothetical protein